MYSSQAQHARKRKSPDGFIVVVVLWILGGLSVLVSVYSVYVIETASGMTVQDDVIRARELTTAAVELAAYQELAIPSASRPSRGDLNFRLGKATVSVQYQSEASRIDLNIAPKPLMAGLFAALGVRSDIAETYADRVAGWRSSSSAENDPEAILYQGMAYGLRGGKFPHVNELALVRTLPPTLIERALPFLTVHSGRAQVNILVADLQVIAAMPGMTPERLSAVLAKRLDPREDRAALLATLGPAQQFATIEAGNTFRMQIKTVLDNGYHASSEVVILLFEDGREPFAVLARRDAIDELGLRTNP